MTNDNSRLLAMVMAACILLPTYPIVAFEGHISATQTRSSEITMLLYTIGPESLRIEVTDDDQPNPVDIVGLDSNSLTLVFPHNCSFIQFQPRTHSPAEIASVSQPVPPTRPPVPSMGLVSPQPDAPILHAPAATALPSGVGAQPGAGIGLPAIPSPNFPADAMNVYGLPAGIGPQSSHDGGNVVLSAMPMMPLMPMMPFEKLELRDTGQKSMLLGFECKRYEIKQDGETMEIWATDQLTPYQPYLRDQLPDFSPHQIEDQWPSLLSQGKLFPLIAILRFDNGVERFRFEVKSITPATFAAKDANLFQPPVGYRENRPRPF